MTIAVGHGLTGLMKLACSAHAGCASYLQRRWSLHYPNWTWTGAIRLKSSVFPSDVLRLARCAGDIWIEMGVESQRTDLFDMSLKCCH